jgi:hypothetical protein
LTEIVAQTDFEIEEAETTIKKLVDKGFVKEDLGPDGRTRYNFS